MTRYRSNAKLFCFISLFFILLSTSLAPGKVSATTGSWDLVGQVGGQIQAVAVSGNKVYAGTGLRLSILDITTPAIPYLLGSSQPFTDFIQDIAISGNYAYVAAGSAGLGVVNIANPLDPEVVATWHSRGYAEGVAVSGSTLYLADGANGLRILDISTPAVPVEIGSAYPFHYALEVSLSGNYVYVAAGGSGLLIVDVTDPSAPLEVGIVDTDGFAYGVDTSEHMAYVADAWQGVQIVDIVNPESAFLRGHCDTPGWALAVELYGSTLFVANGANGMRILNVGNPDAPFESGFLANPKNFVRRLVANEYTVFLADQLRGMRVVNATNLAVPVELGSYAEMSEARYLVVDGNYAYVAAGTEGNLYIMNVADPGDPFQAGKFTGAGYSSSIGVSGDHAYLGTFMDTPNYMWVINKSNPAAPTQTTVVPLASLDPSWGAPRELVIQGNFVYLADEWGLRIYDIAVPSAIHLEGKIQTLWVYGETVGVDVSGNYVYLAGSGNGVIVIDVSNPANPLYVESTPPNGFTSTVDISGNRLYTGNNGVIEVFDATNPLSIPPALGAYATPGAINGVKVVGTTLFVSDGGGGVQVLDVSNPAAISLIQAIQTPGFAYQSVPVGDLLYVAAGRGGMLIFEKHTTRSVTPPASQLIPSADTLYAEDLPLGVPFVLPGAKKNESLIYEQVVPSEPQVVPAERATCTVTSIADTNTSGTLRTCMSSAVPGTVITFNPTTFPPASPKVINLASPLPSLDDGNVTIDASNAGVILDGGGSVERAIEIGSSNNTVMGLQIRNFKNDGIVIGFPSQNNQVGGDHSIGAAPSGQGNAISGCFNGIRLLYTSNNWVKGNFIGTNATGTAAGAINTIGIVISSEAYNNHIGGLTQGERNIVSGNDRGIDVADTSAQFNSIAGNNVGTDVSGSYAIPNSSGIVLETGARNNIVGGTTPGERNLVSGNNFGIVVSDALTMQNSVIGNWVGMDASGMHALPNTNKGISVFSTGYNRVGGSLPGEGNLVSGQTSSSGLTIGGFEFTDAIVMGNRFGFDASGASGLGNGTGISIETPHNFIGGLGIGNGNTLAGNTWGIAATSAGASNNWVAGNSITDGGSMGIYLAPGADHNFMIMNQVSAYNEGVRVERSYKNTLRANSISGCGWKGLFLLDGGNHDLPAPAINSLTEAGVAGSTCSYCLVDVFSDPGSQGLIYEGFTVADGSGNYSFAKRLMGPNVTVSVTDLDGNTSEFSNPTGITWTWFKNFLPLILR
jgi:hypothetical protein